VISPVEQPAMSFRLSFHLALLERTGAYWLDDPPDLSCQDSTRQHPVDDPLLSCNPLRATRGRGSSACQSASCHQMECLVPAPPIGTVVWAAPEAAARRLIIRLIIQTIRRDPSGAVWTDGPPNVSRPDRSGADQIDAEHQTTDLAVGGSNPSRRAQRPRSEARTRIPGLDRVLIRRIWSDPDRSGG
jgi:hypothetical protein